MTEHALTDVLVTLGPIISVGAPSRLGHPGGSLVVLHDLYVPYRSASLAIEGSGGLADQASPVYSRRL